MLTIIIYSKDRPAQLDLLLRSIGRYMCWVKDIIVLFKHTATRFEYGYHKIALDHHGVRLFHQDPFKKRMLQRLKDLKTPYVLPICDDYVLIGRVKPSIIDEALADKDVKAFSLLLHPGITHSFAHVKPLKKPEFLKYGPYYMWNWTYLDPKSDWGYPHQAGGNVYKTKYFYKLLRFKRFQAPNSMESAISWPKRKRKPFHSPYMACFPEQKMLATAINCTQVEVTGNRLAENKYGLEWLNDMYLSGKLIEMDQKQSNKVMDDVQIKWR